MIDGFVAIFIFMLAAFTGYEVIGRVPVILHTPLMSGSNFVHGIVARRRHGGARARPRRRPSASSASSRVLLGAANAVGGYVVTERMLEMFKSSASECGSRRTAGRCDGGRCIDVIQLSYIAATVLFILGLKRHELAAHRAPRHRLGRRRHGDRHGWPPS